MIATAALLYLGLFLLAGRMQRHQAILLGPWRDVAKRTPMDLAGWGILLLSLASLARAGEWSFAVVAWIGLSMAVGAVMVMGITYRPALLRGLALAAPAVVIVDLLANPA